MTIKEKGAAMLGIPFLTNFLTSLCFVNSNDLCPDAPQISGQDAEGPDFFYLIKVSLL